MNVRSMHAADYDARKGFDSTKDCLVCASNPPYGYGFFVEDRDEPHVHIEREDKVAKFWLDPDRLQSSVGFSRNEIIRLQKIVGEYQIQLREAWNAYFHD